MSKNIRHKKTFTLIEMIIVVVVIGILVVALVPRIQHAQDRAKIGTVKMDIRNIAMVIVTAQTDQAKTLYQLTKYNCTYCLCSSVTVPLNTLTETHICKVWRYSAIDFLFTLAGQQTGNSIVFHKDPRGSPYLLDENEYEYNNTDCRPDILGSAGPNAEMNYSWATTRWVFKGTWLGANDDISIWLQSTFCRE